MGKFIIDIPEKLHDQLRHISIDTKKDMKDLIVYALANYMRLMSPVLAKNAFKKEK